MGLGQFKNYYHKKICYYLNEVPMYNNYMYICTCIITCYLCTRALRLYKKCKTNWTVRMLNLMHTRPLLVKVKNNWDS